MEYSFEDIAVVALREYGGVGPRAFEQLIAHFGTPQAIFEAPQGEIAALPRMSDEKEEKIRVAIEYAETIRLRLQDYADRSIYLTTVYSDDYPAMLLDMPDAPPSLYYRGQIGICREDAVAIVGSHEASDEGIAESVRLGTAIAAAGTVVVSGLARGIDAAAHVGTLKSDGKAVAVLGCGFDNIYPSEHQPLADAILERGLLISEYPPESTVDSGRLLARNRIIVGLAKSVIVVEITTGSGGTATAIKETIAQGKALFTCFNPNLNGSSTNSLGAVHLKREEDWKMVLRYMV